MEIPPVLVDSSDVNQEGILPLGATRQVLPEYGFAWVAVRLANGAAGIPALQKELAGLARSMQRRETRLTGRPSRLSVDINRPDVTRHQVQQSIRPEAIALTVFGGITALALLVLVGQGLMQLISRSAPDVAMLRTLGATRIQAAAASSLAGLMAVVGGIALAVAGAVALSPLAPVGPVRDFDPDRGIRADGLVLGAGAASLAIILLSLLAMLAARSAWPRRSAAPGRASAVALAAARAGLPVTAVIGSRIAWQTTLTLLIAGAVGLPLGIAAGRWAWHWFAGSLGAVPVAEVPVPLLIAGVIVLAAAGNLLTSVPAAIAARTRPSASLRAE